MKRLHVHVTVDDLDRAIVFYSHLFDAEPAVRKSDYAKWMVDDPRVNFAVSSRAGKGAGVDHLGIQVDDEAELADVEGRLRAAEARVLPQPGAACCYAKADKAWSFDPQGVPREAYVLTGEARVFGDDTLAIAMAQAPTAQASTAQASTG